MFSPQRIPQQHPTSPGASRPPPVVPLVSTEGEDQRTAHHAATPSSCRTTGKSDHPFSSSHQKPARCLILGQPRVSLTHTSCSCAPGAALLQSMQEARCTQPDGQTFSSSEQRIQLFCKEREDHHLPPSTRGWAEDHHPVPGSCYSLSQKKKEIVCIFNISYWCTNSRSQLLTGNISVISNAVQEIQHSPGHFSL